MNKQEKPEITIIHARYIPSDPDTTVMENYNFQGSSLKFERHLHPDALVYEVLCLINGQRMGGLIVVNPGVSLETAVIEHFNGFRDMVQCKITLYQNIWN